MLERTHPTTRACIFSAETIFFAFGECSLSNVFLLMLEAGATELKISSLDFLTSDLLMLEAGATELKLSSLDFLTLDPH